MGIAPDEELGDVEGLVRGLELLHFVEAQDFRESFFSVAFSAWAMGNQDERFISNVALMHGDPPGNLGGISGAPGADQAANPGKSAEIAASPSRAGGEIGRLGALTLCQVVAGRERRRNV